MDDVFEEVVGKNFNFFDIRICEVYFVGDVVIVVVVGRGFVVGGVVIWCYGCLWGFKFEE